MDETTKSLIDAITVRSDKPFTVPNGEQCTVFYDCVQLNPNDLARLAAEAMGDVQESSFDLVLGIAYRGILYAAAVAGGKKVSVLQADGKLSGPSLRGQRVVIADDVVHTGTQMKKAADVVKQAGGNIAGYVCIVDRSNGKFGSATQPLWSAYQTDFA